MHRVHRYAGPEEIARRALEQPVGTIVRSASELAQATRTHGGTSTYVVGFDGLLRVAPRESEHVACAGAPFALTAGELVMERGRFVSASNLSTGFCPDETSFPALGRALSGIASPEAFEPTFVLRRCEACGARCVVKEEVFECAECGADLPKAYNFERTRWHRVFLGAWILDRVEAPSDRDEDRVGFHERDGVLRLALADGAGGMTGGGEAAMFAVQEALMRPAEVASVQAIDLALADRGQSTLITLSLSADVHGASVGDSRAWARSNGVWSELTAGQARKPLVGSGRSLPRSWSRAAVDAVAVTSDGLANHLTEAQLLAGLERADLIALVDGVRLPTSTLRDDVSLLVARRQ